MTRYTVQPKNRVFVKGCWLLSIARNMGKYLIKNLSIKNRQKFLHHAKQSAADGSKTASKREIQKQLPISLEIKLLIKLQGFQKLHQRIILK